MNTLLRGESRCDGFCPSNQKLTPEGLQPISTFPLIGFLVFFSLFFTFLLAFLKVDGGNKCNGFMKHYLLYDLILLCSSTSSTFHISLSLCVFHLTQISSIINLFCMDEANVKCLKISQACRKHKVHSLSFQFSPGILASFLVLFCFFK